MESGEMDLLSKQAILSLPRDVVKSLDGKILDEYINVKDIEALPTVQSQSTAGQLNDSAQSTNLIDRQQAIDALDCINGVEEVLRSLPSAQPEPHEGHWIPVHPIQSDDPGAYMCSKCKTGMWEIRPSSYHYCPNCGAKMKGAKHETD